MAFRETKYMCENSDKYYKKLMNLIAYGGRCYS